MYWFFLGLLVFVVAIAALVAGVIQLYCWIYGKVEKMPNTWRLVTDTVLLVASVFFCGDVLSILGNGWLALLFRLEYDFSVLMFFLRICGTAVESFCAPGSRWHAWWKPLETWVLEARLKIPISEGPLHISMIAAGIGLHYLDYLQQQYMDLAMHLFDEALTVPRAELNHLIDGAPLADLGAQIVADA
jgi:hypothetical protein